MTDSRMSKLCKCSETKKIFRVICFVLTLALISGGIGAGIAIGVKREAKKEDSINEIQVRFSLFQTINK